MAAPSAAVAPPAAVRPLGKGRSRYDHVTFRACEPCKDFAEWKGVWVIVEHRDGKLRDVTRELLGAARPMADKLGHKVTAVLLGHHVDALAQELLDAGADEVLVCEHPILRTPLARPSTDVLNRLISERKPNIVLIGATHTGRDISSRVAATIDAGMTADCTELDVDTGNGELLARRPAFGGKMLATIRCDRHRPQMATARPGIFVPLPAHKGRKGRVEKVDVSWLSGNTYPTEVIDYVLDTGVDITKAEVLVAGGLGVGGPEGFVKLQELADALGGLVACSRPVADKGWMERSRQVGQTGVSVRPKLYIAVGISGAIQHIEGMKEAGTVIAINKDPNAPIMHYADLALVGDWKAHVDALVAEARRRNLKGAKWMVPTKDTLDADRQAAAERAQKTKEKAVAPAAPAPHAEPPKPPKPPTEAPAPARHESPKETRPPRPTAELRPETAQPKSAVSAVSAAPSPTAPHATVTVAAPAWPAKYEGNTKDRDAVKAYAKAVPEEKKAWVLAADCIVCNACQSACPTDAAIVTNMARVDRDLCIADGACFDACPTGAIRPGAEDKPTSGGWPAGSRLAGQFGTPEG